MKVTKVLPAAALAFLILPAGAQSAGTAQASAPSGGTASPTPAEIIIICKQAPAYPLTTCVACNRTLPPVAVDYVKSTRLFRLDLTACKGLVDADVPGMTKKITDAVIAVQKPKYPMKVSPVSDKSLDTTAVDYVWGTKLVRLANREEIPAFETGADAAMEKVDKAWIAALVPLYKLKTCPVSGEPLGGTAGTPVDYLHGIKLVRFCCSKCKPTFDLDPERYMKIVVGAL